MCVHSTKQEQKIKRNKEYETNIQYDGREFPLMVLNHESIEALSGNIRELGDGIHESRLICALHPLQMRSEQEKIHSHRNEGD